MRVSAIEESGRTTLTVAPPSVSDKDDVNVCEPPNPPPGVPPPNTTTRPPAGNVVPAGNVNLVEAPTLSL